MPFIIKTTFGALDLSELTTYQEMSDGSTITYGTAHGVTEQRLPVVVTDWHALLVESHDVVEMSEDSTLLLDPNTAVYVMSQGWFSEDDRPDYL